VALRGHGEIPFEPAGQVGCEAIVSKRLGSPYRSGRSPHWVKVKNPAAPKAGSGNRWEAVGCICGSPRTKYRRTHLCYAAISSLRFVWSCYAVREARRRVSFYGSRDFPQD
jgi:hypothetical protein